METICFTFVGVMRGVKNYKLVYDGRNPSCVKGTGFREIINIHASWMRYLCRAFFPLHSTRYFSIKGLRERILFTGFSIAATRQKREGEQRDFQLSRLMNERF